MYEEFYGLTANPFRLTPDSKFFYGSEGHRKAMSYLKYGLYQGEGFIVITGGGGTGKSTLVGQLFSELDGNDIVAAQIGNTQVDADNCIRLICNAFEIDVESRDKADLITAFEEFLIAQNQMGRRVLLVVDEAQNMPLRALEELRMLSNFNVGGQPLFQSFLLGQPQFLQTVAHKDLAQLQQRIMASYKLAAMSEEETEEYIQHRLEMVGWHNNPSFTPDAFGRIYDETKGVPRLINTLANRIMLFASLEEASNVDLSMVETVIEDQNNEDINPDIDDEDDEPAARGGGRRGGKSDMISGERLAKIERAVTVLARRLEKLEDRSTQHDEAIHELIDLAMKAYGGDAQDDDDDDHAQLRHA